MSNFFYSVTLALSLLLPVVMAFFILYPRWQRVLIRLLPLAVIPGLIAALWFSPPESVSIPWMLLGSGLVLDNVGQFFLLLTTLLWAAAAMYASSSVGKIQFRSRFYFCFLLAMAGNIGVALAADAVGFYTYFALMSFSAYGMIVSDNDAQTERAGRIYMAFVIIGEVMLFSGLVMGSLSSSTVNLYNTWSIGTDNIAAALIIFGFGIKVGALPFHFILPIIYRAAPPPATVALAGAMLNAGLLGWLRFLPLGQEVLPVWGSTLMVLGLIAAFFGVAMGLTQRNAKALLGYSSVSQMGLMTSGVGLTLLVPSHWTTLSEVLLLYAMSHALAKGALFYAVTLPVEKSGWRMVWQRIALIFPALAISGAPLTSGMIVKDALKAALVMAPQPWAQWFSLLLPLSAIATALLMLRLLILIWAPYHAAEQDGGSMHFGQLLLILSLLFLPALWVLPGGYMALWSFSRTVNATWPLLVAGAIGTFVVYVLQPRWRISRWLLPPGDIWLWLERGLSGLQSLPKFPGRKPPFDVVQRFLKDLLAYFQYLGAAESWLRVPQVAGMVAALVFIAIVLATR